MTALSTNNPLLPEILNICLESLEEVKKAYSEANSLRAKVVELEKVASVNTSPAIDNTLVDQTVKNLAASSFIGAEDGEKLAAEIKKDPSVALRLVQRFIEISAPPYSEGQGVEKFASAENTVGDLDGWLNVVSKGA